MAEPTKMSFWLWAGTGSRNHVLDRGPDPTREGGNFERGKRRPIVKYSNSLPSAVQKWLNRSRFHLGFGLRWAQGSIIRWGHTGATWRIPLNWTCVAAMRPVVILLWPLVY